MNSRNEIIPKGDIAYVSNTITECKDRCLSIASCHFWTWANPSLYDGETLGRCWAKTKDGEFSTQNVPSAVTSGTKTCTCMDQTEYISTLEELGEGEETTNADSTTTTPTTTVSDDDVCQCVQTAVEYVGPALSDDGNVIPDGETKYTEANLKKCRDACSDLEECEYWVWGHPSITGGDVGRCWLKDGDAVLSNENIPKTVVSGTKTCDCMDNDALEELDDDLDDDVQSDTTESESSDTTAETEEKCQIHNSEDQCTSNACYWDVSAYFCLSQD